MSLPDFKYLRPRTLDHALALLSQYATDIDAKQNDARVQIVAGGTDILPSMKQKLFTPEVIVDISGIRELRGVTLTAEGLTIGALTPLARLEHDPLIARDYQVFHDALKTVASPILRNMGTIGGNICLDTRCVWYNQSLQWRKSCGFCIKKDGDICHVAPGGSKCWAAFSADTPPALLCRDAEVEVAGAAGSRRIPLRDFYTNIGDDRNQLKDTEILTRVFLPNTSAGLRGNYQKLRLRGTIDYPLAGVAITALLDGETIANLRVAITGVNPAPHLVPGLDQVAAGKPLTQQLALQIAQMAVRTAKPLTTSLLTPEYRREMVRVFSKRAVENLLTP
ncbi:MAG: xanthine dehydrogenase family protein subunit M [Acidobacteriaceae bacterium]